MEEKQSFSAILRSPIGYLGINLAGEKLVGLKFLGSKKPSAKVEAVKGTSSKKAVNSALNSYFSDPKNVDLPEIELAGTEYQKKIWKVLKKIGPGKTRTYGDIAKELKTSPRAVGNACRRNPVPIFIPCHRVVAASGRGGFMGYTTGEPMKIKDWLLTHEQETASKTG